MAAHAFLMLAAEDQHRRDGQIQRLKITGKQIGQLFSQDGVTRSLVTLDIAALGHGALTIVVPYNYDEEAWEIDATVFPIGLSPEFRSDLLIALNSEPPYHL